MCDYDFPDGSDGCYLQQPYKCEFMRPGDLLYRVDYDFRLIEEYVILEETQNLIFGTYFVAKSVYSEESTVKPDILPVDDDGEWFLTASDAAQQLAKYLLDMCKSCMDDCKRITACKDRNEFESLIYRAR